MDKRWKIFGLTNGALCALALFWAGAIFFSDALGIKRFIFSCPFHDLFALYCPTCGFTRAFLALLHLDIWGALCANPAAVLLVCAVIYFDVRALISLKRGEKCIFHAKLWHFIAFLAIMLVWCIVSNVLLRVWGIDFLGDFI